MLCLRKCLYYHYLTTKVMSQEQTFRTACPTHAGKAAGIDMVWRNYVTVTLCIWSPTDDVVWWCAVITTAVEKLLLYSCSSVLNAANCLWFQVSNKQHWMTVNALHFVVFYQVVCSFLKQRWTMQVIQLTSDFWKLIEEFLWLHRDYFLKLPRIISRIKQLQNIFFK